MRQQCSSRSIACRVHLQIARAASLPHFSLVYKKVLTRVGGWLPRATRPSDKNSERKWNLNGSGIFLTIPGRGACIENTHTHHPTDQQAGPRGGEKTRRVFGPPPSCIKSPFRTPDRARASTAAGTHAPLTRFVPTTTAPTAPRAAAAARGARTTSGLEKAAAQRRASAGAGLAA